MRARRSLAVAVVVGGVLVSLPATVFAQTLVPCKRARAAKRGRRHQYGRRWHAEPHPCMHLHTHRAGQRRQWSGRHHHADPHQRQPSDDHRSSATDFRFFWSPNGESHPGRPDTAQRPHRRRRRDSIGPDGRLTLSASTITGNTATLGTGGGIHNFSGTAAVNNSTLSNNTATQGGGFFNILADATFNGSAVTDNHVISEAVGGGIYNAVGSVILNNTRIADNDATFSGGPGEQSLGAGVANGGILTLTGSPVINNIVSGHGRARRRLVEHRHTEHHQQPDHRQCRDRNECPRRRHPQRVRHHHPAGRLGGHQPSGGSGADGGGIFRADGAVTLSATSVAGNRPNNCGNPSTVSGCS